VYEDIQLNARQDGLDDGSKAARRSTERSLLPCRRAQDGRTRGASRVWGRLDQSRVGSAPFSMSSRQEYRLRVYLTDANSLLSLGGEYLRNLRVGIVRPW